MVTPREEAAGGDRHGSPLAVSNIAESICPAIPGERQLEHSSGRNTRIFSRRMLQLLFSRNLACCASCNIVYPRRTVYASCEDHYLLPIFQTRFL